MDKLDDAVRLYKADKLLQSARVLEEVNAQLGSLLRASSPSPEDAATAASLEARLSDPEVQRIALEAEEVASLKASFESKDGWTLSYDGAQSKVWYRAEAGTASHSMLVEGEIEAPLLNLAALMYEADLYPDLLWFVLSSSVLEDHARVRRSAHFTLYAPWPLYDREVAVYGYAVDGLDADDHCVLVLSRSLRPSDNVTVPPPAARRTLSTKGTPVRADVHLAGYELTPQSPARTRVRAVFNVDPKLPFVPTALINWSSRTVCRWSLRALESRARNLPPAYHARMAERGIYKWFQSRLLEYWTEMGRLDEYEGPVDEMPAQRRLSGNFDVEATPEAPTRSVVSALLAMQASVMSGGGTGAAKGKSFTSRFFGARD